MKKKLPKAQKGIITKATKVIKPTKTTTTTTKVTIPKVDPRSGKPLTIHQINAIKSGKKLDFHTVDQQNAKRDLKKAVESRTNPKPPAKKSTYNSRQSDYEKALWESYQKYGGSTKPKSIKKMEVGGAADTDCWPGKPGCKYKKSQRVNARRRFWNSDTGKTVKKIGAGVAAAGAGVAAYAKNAFGMKDKVKDLMGQQKGGSVRKRK
jgi:hypothetical protein